MDSLTKRIALSELKRFKRQEAEYAEAVDDWYRAGDGRSPKWITELAPDGTPYQINVGGHGYRYPECPHGMSLWTDYDNICGACEDGASVYELAISSAHRIAREFMSRMDWVSSAPNNLTPELRSALVNWACEPVANL